MINCKKTFDTLMFWCTLRKIPISYFYAHASIMLPSFKMSSIICFPSFVYPSVRTPVHPYEFFLKSTDRIGPKYRSNRVEVPIQSGRGTDRIGPKYWSNRVEVLIESCRGTDRIGPRYRSNRAEVPIESGRVFCLVPVQVIEQIDVKDMHNVCVVLLLFRLLSRNVMACFEIQDEPLLIYA